jgi:hypothetical protein
MATQPCSSEKQHKVKHQSKCRVPRCWASDRLGHYPELHNFFVHRVQPLHACMRGLLLLSEPRVFKEDGPVTRLAVSHFYRDFSRGHQIRRDSVRGTDLKLKVREDQLKK